MDLANLHKRIATIENLQRENREAREMLKAELENDATYRETLEMAEAASKEKKRVKEEIENSGSNSKLIETIQENNEELSTLKEILSAELAEVYVESKKDEIVDENGEVRKFKISAQLVAKGKKYENRDSFGKYKESEKE